MFPSEANAVFLEMPSPMIDGLRERGWRFYTFIGSGGARFMCSWETTEDDVASLVADMHELAGRR
jgi:threonine aldolase